jgi:hypothetical protein
LGADQIATSPRTVVFRYGQVWAYLDFATNRCGARLNDRVLAAYIRFKMVDPELLGLGYNSGAEILDYQEKLWGADMVCRQRAVSSRAKSSSPTNRTLAKIEPALR